MSEIFSYTKFVIPDIKFGFTCGESDLYQNIVKCQNIMTRTVATFKDFASFIDCISKTNKTEVDNAKDLDVVIPMYNLLEYNNNYAKASGGLWQYHKYYLNNNVTDFESIKFEARIIGRTSAFDTKC